MAQTETFPTAPSLSNIIGAMALGVVGGIAFIAYPVLLDHLEELEEKRKAAERVAVLPTYDAKILSENEASLKRANLVGHLPDGRQIYMAEVQHRLYKNDIGTEVHYVYFTSDGSAVSENHGTGGKLSPKVADIHIHQDQNLQQAMAEIANSSSGQTIE